MAKNKRMKKLYSEIDPKKSYPIEKAVELVKKTSTANFDETIEVHIRLNINPKKGEQQVRSTTVLPHKFGKAKKIAAFVPESKKQEAEKAGADLVITEDEIVDFAKKGKINFDLAVACPETMKSLAPLAKTLGPKGLMPSPKNDTIAKDLEKTIGELKKGKIAFKNDDSANIHQAIGKVSTDNKALIENYETFMQAVQAAKPDSAKGVFIKNISICSSMGPGLKLEIK
ncbi:MAG TPA: 50S ribosomal protein L1 [Patescibacteria group bacterium]|nr:50S ribosomal protein L1 [Patescibacteria group bacterium]